MSDEALRVANERYAHLASNCHIETKKLSYFSLNRIDFCNLLIIKEKYGCSKNSHFVGWPHFPGLKLIFKYLSTDLSTGTVEKFI